LIADGDFALFDKDVPRRVCSGVPRGIGRVAGRPVDGMLPKRVLQGVNLLQEPHGIDVAADLAQLHRGRIRMAMRV
jgi:hypothetical protein